MHYLQTMLIAALVIASCSGGDEDSSLSDATDSLQSESLASDSDASEGARADITTDAGDTDPMGAPDATEGPEDLDAHRGQTPDGTHARTEPTDVSEGRGTETVLTLGQQHAIELPSNITTGYSWTIISPADQAVLTLVSSDYSGPEETPPGTGGVEKFVFEAVGPGTENITLHYVRPWEDRPPVDTYSEDILVTP